MVEWNPGAVFSLSWLIFFFPIGVAGTLWFWQRRDKQPIKAREPLLVVLTDVVLLVYLVLLCLQRIVRDSYPCLLNLWNGYIGTIILLNTYLWRCWTLYFRFRLTQERLSQVKTKDLPFFMRQRSFASPAFLGKVSATLTIVLTLPCGLITASSTKLSSEYGDTCSKEWTDTVLAVYVVLYAAAFGFLSFSLRAVVDGFKIKEEMRFTGAIGVISLIPWIIFNTRYKSFNTETFPVSTLSLLVAGVAAFAASTLWPLYRSIFEPPAIDTGEVPSNYTTFDGVLSIPQGQESFKQFLTKEFSVENLLFYQEVDDLRRLSQELMNDPEADPKLLAKTSDLYNKYCIVNAPFQVNLPDNIVKALVKDFRNYTYDLNSRIKAGKKHEYKAPPPKAEVKLDAPTVDADGGPDAALTALRQQFPLIFDEAQKNIYKLMKSDSFPRYVRNQLYKEFVTAMSSKQHTSTVLKEMGMV